MRQKAIRIPKLLNAELMRKTLGDAEYERIITVMYADKLLPALGVPASTDQLQAGIDLLVNAGALGEYKKLAQAGRGWQRFFTLNAMISKRYIAFAKQEIAAAKGETPEGDALAPAQENGNGATPGANLPRATATSFPVKWTNEAHTTGTRVCNTCLEEKMVDTVDRKNSGFYINTTDGRPHGRCKICTNEAGVERKRAIRDAIRSSREAVTA